MIFFAAKTLGDLELPGKGGGTTTVTSVFQNGIELAYWGIGILSVALILFAAFRIVTARGDVEKAKKGRLEIVWGMVGLGIAVLAGVITSVVINAVPGN